MRAEYEPQITQIYADEGEHLMDVPEFQASARDPETYAIIGAAMEVHKELGHGFLEHVYHDALRLEFARLKIPAAHEVELPVFYKGEQLPCLYRADFVCFGRIIVEIKAIKDFTDIERAQVIHYLRATRFDRAVLLNFGRKSLQYERIVHGFKG